MIPLINTISDLEKLFPANTQELAEFTKNIINPARDAINKLYILQESSSESASFENLMAVIDEVQMSFTVGFSVLNALQMLTTNSKLRKELDEHVFNLEEVYNKLILYNKKLYDLVLAYSRTCETENLSGPQKKFIKETLYNWELNGLNLPANKLQELKDISVSIDDHMAQYDHNLLYAHNMLYITQDKLLGVPESYIQDLNKAPNGGFALQADTVILESCTLESTRIKFWKLLVNKAYPQNLLELQNIVAGRDKLARLVGFTSYADYDIATQMAKNPELVENFLHSVIAGCQKKLKKELAQIIRHLPPDIKLTQDNKFKPWDMWYIKNYYKQHVLRIDEDAISEYFPAEHTLEKLLSFVQEFFDIKITKQAYGGLWSDELIILQVHKHKKQLGYIILDLFTRKDKYEYILEQPIMPSYIDKNGALASGVTVITADFAKPTRTEPSLLRFSDVMVFMHEFGHALHTLLGAQEIISFAGSQVDRDFVEMPSQMLEQWLWDPGLLKAFSGHYKTGKQLSDAAIKTIIKLKKFDNADLLLEQSYYALFSLELYKEGAHKDISALNKRLAQEVRPHIEFSDFDHSYASFDHLLSYGAKYYGYLWSRVFALDLLEYIQKQGDTPRKLKAMGKKYVNEILAPGASEEPEVLLKNFLGRAPKLDAFFKDLVK